MRSQKQNNRAPRPFKNQQSAGRWSGQCSGENLYFSTPKFLQLNKAKSKPLTCTKDDLPDSTKPTSKETPLTEG
jgi:hypothetical protein